MSPHLLLHLLTNISEIRKHLGPASSLSEQPSRPASTGKSCQPSLQLTSIFETLIEQCKIETEKSWAQEKESFQQTIHKLTSELADEHVKVEEAERKANDWQDKSCDWQSKYEKLKEKLAGLMGDE